MKTYEKSSYQKKLDDPRWQKKRLEVMERAGWRCEECECETAQLHVHHRYYVAKREPWAYPNWCYRSLCKECHKQETEIRSEEHENFEDFFAMFEVEPYAINFLIDDLRCSLRLPAKELFEVLTKLVRDKIKAEHQ